MFRLEMVTRHPAVAGCTNDQVAAALREAADAVEVAEAVYCEPSGVVEVVDQFGDVMTVGWWKLTESDDEGANNG